MVLADSKRYGVAGVGMNFLNKLMFNPGFRFMVLFRTCQSFSVYNPVGLMSRLFYKRMQVRYGLQIPHTCKIGKGLFLGHYGNIVINQKVVIGENCNIGQGVTLGYVSRGEKKGCPKIGSRVWIGPNAVIVGNISIGNDVLIAPLSYINFDVPDHSVIAGNPAKIISCKGSDGYLKNLA